MTNNYKTYAFRIYTEDKNEEGIKALANQYFKGYTLYKAQGYWLGLREDSLVLEVLGDGLTTDLVNRLATDIKNLNHQQAVLVQRVKNNSWLIE